MDHFANSLVDSILEDLVEKRQLVDEFWMLDFILGNLQEDDPLFPFVAERYTLLGNSGQSPLHLEQLEVLIQMYSRFFNLVAERQASLREMIELGAATGTTDISSEGVV